MNGYRHPVLTLGFLVMVMFLLILVPQLNGTENSNKMDLGVF